MPRGEKKITTWNFWINSKRVDVPVYMQTIGAAIFRVRLPEHDIKASGQNIADLKRETEALLKEKFALEWKPFLHVNFEGSTDSDLSSPSDNINLKLNIMEVLVASRGKNKFHKFANPRYGTGVRNGLPKTGNQSMERKEADMYALIPDTPVNRAALDTLIKSFQALVKRLEKIMNPKMIETTLANAARGLLTAAPTQSKRQATKS
jgi:hypothetical protein